MNLDLDAFTYITGLAGLLGLFIQFKDGFAEHREARKTIVFLLLGIFVGSLISAARGIKVDFGASISPINALVAFVAVVVAFVAVVAIFTREAERRGEMFGFTAFGALVLLVLVLGAAIASSTDTRRIAEQLTLEELITLADSAETRGSYERALFMLEKARTGMDPSDARRQVLAEREKVVKQKQVGQQK